MILGVSATCSTSSSRGSSRRSGGTFRAAAKTRDSSRRSPIAVLDPCDSNPAQRMPHVRGSLGQLFGSDVMRSVPHTRTRRAVISLMRRGRAIEPPPLVMLEHRTESLRILPGNQVRLPGVKNAGNYGKGRPMEKLLAPKPAGCVARSPEVDRVRLELPRDGPSGSASGRSSGTGPPRLSVGSRSAREFRERQTPIRFLHLERVGSFARQRAVGSFDDDHHYRGIS